MKLHSRKRCAIAITVTFLICSNISLISTSYAATAKAGSSCAKAGTTKTISGKKYVCAKNIAKKLVWLIPFTPKIGSNSPSTSGTKSTKPSIAGGAGGDDNQSGDGEHKGRKGHGAQEGNESNEGSED